MNAPFYYAPGYQVIVDQPGSEFHGRRFTVTDVKFWEDGTGGVFFYGGDVLFHKRFEHIKPVIKVISLTQPWATLMAIQAKQTETRGWGTTYRGVLAIHAAAKFPKEAQALVHQEPFRSALSGTDLTRGAILSIGELYHINKVRNAEDIPDYPESFFGDYSLGRAAWGTRNMIQLPEPIPHSGRLGLWEPDPASYDMLWKLLKEGQ